MTSTRHPYPTYRPSGVEWLGDLPEHWEAARVTEMFEARSGGTPSTAEEAYWEGDTPWVSAKDMKALRIRDTEDHISEEAVRASATSLVPRGTVLLVARSGILKHTLPVGLSEREVAINQDIKGLIPRTALVEPLYFVYWVHGLQSALLTQWRQQGATVESLDFDAVRSTRCPLPPLDEQRAIAAFLDRETERIDALVAKKRQLIERLREYRTALITRTVTRGLPPDAARAAGLDPSPRLKPSGVEWLGDVPEHWEVKELRRLLAEPLKYGANEPAELDDPELPRYVRITDIDESDALRPETFRSLPPEVAAPFLLEDGDLLFARSGATVGKSFLYQRSWGPCAYAGYLIRARLEKQSADARFVRYFTATSTFWQWLASIYVQATIQNVNAERYASLMLSVPPLSEQRAIVEFLAQKTGQVDTLANRVETAVERLQEHRMALITAAVTGKIDVRKAATAAGGPAE